MFADAMDAGCLARGEPPQAPLTQKRVFDDDIEVVLTRWITVRIDRHPDFGGGTIDADLPDTPLHRRYYEGRIVREFSQLLDPS